MRQELDLHARHVDAGRALALAALARNTQVERVLYSFLAFVAQLIRKREAQGIRAAAGEVAFVLRRAVGGAHRAGIELAAVAVVVAHLHRLVVTAPFAPIQGWTRSNSLVSRLEAEQRLVVHARGIDDLAWVHQAARVEPGLDLGQRRGEARTEERRDPLRAHQPVAVLAGVGAFVLLHHGAGFLRDRAHLLGAIAAHVEHRPDVQRTDRRVRVPGAARAMLLEHARQAFGVFRQ